MSSPPPPTPPLHGAVGDKARISFTGPRGGLCSLPSLLEGEERTALTVLRTVPGEPGRNQWVALSVAVVGSKGCSQILQHCCNVWKVSVAPAVRLSFNKVTNPPKKKREEISHASC